MGTFHFLAVATVERWSLERADCAAAARLRSSRILATMAFLRSASLVISGEPPPSPSGSGSSSMTGRTLQPGWSTTAAGPLPCPILNQNQSSNLLAVLLLDDQDTSSVAVLAIYTHGSYQPMDVQPMMPSSLEGSSKNSRCRN